MSNYTPEPKNRIILIISCKFKNKFKNVNIYLILNPWWIMMIKIGNNKVSVLKEILIYIRIPAICKCWRWKQMKMKSSVRMSGTEQTEMLVFYILTVTYGTYEEARCSWYFIRIKLIYVLFMTTYSLVPELLTALSDQWRMLIMPYLFEECYCYF